MENVKKILAPSGRWAIFAREDEKSPWIQIESVVGEDNADDLLENLENDATERHAYIYDNEDEVEEWGDNGAKAE